METEKYGLERNENGKFLPGNRAAAERGPNKVSTKVKQSLIQFLENNIDSVQESFNSLKHLEKLQFIANILPYVVPKMSQSESNTKLSGGITIRWTEPRLLDSGNKGSNGELHSVQKGLPDNLQPGGHEVG